MISVAHLTRRFGEFVALNDVGFEIARGEVVGFLGPNGAGKTTTLRVIAGYLPATSGVVRVAGLDIVQHSLEVRQRIGYLPESVPLYPEHRVVEMLEFQARLHRMSRERTRRRIPEVLERVGIKDRSRQLIRHLSRGLRQRVGLAVALLPEPEVLILDEPTSGLDPLQRIEVRTLIRELADKHTVLLSSHILPEIEAVCPRVIIIHRGCIAADGTKAELVQRLAHASHTRLEAFLGQDVALAMRLVRALPGVQDVTDRGRLGIHHCLDIHSAEDVRESVGALAAQRGWAIRELSWRKPTLEEIFARIALGHDDESVNLSASEREKPEAGAFEQGSGDVKIELSPDLARATARVEAPAASTPPKIVYNLNPFDMGASRDLSRPKAIDEPRADPDPPARNTR